MSCCPHCLDAEDLFSRRAARRDLRRYRRRGPRASTRRLLEGLGEVSGPDITLLDVGGGVGAVQHELFERGLASAVHVDASAAYLEVSRGEAEERGHGDRISYIHGDIVDLAEELPEADIVTLDRVICCYPDMESLVAATAAKAKRLYGIVYPRERWMTRLMLGMANLFFWLRRSAFRGYLYPPEAIDAAVTAHGFRRQRASRTIMWEAVTYSRV